MRRRARTAAAKNRDCRRGNITTAAGSDDIASDEAAAGSIRGGRGGMALVLVTSANLNWPAPLKLVPLSMTRP
jgi:hypothetical protein